MILANASKPRGKNIDMSMFVDSDHVGDNKSHKSRSDSMIHLSKCYLKKESTVKTSVLEVEFMGMKRGADVLTGLQNKAKSDGI